MKWTEHAEDIRALIDAGTPYRQIGAQYGVQEKTMSRIISRLGLSNPKIGRWTPEVLATITAMREAGASWVEIGEKYGCGWAHVCTTYHDRLRKLDNRPETPEDEMAWLAPTMSEDAFLDRVRADGGHVVCREVRLERNRYGAVLFRQDRIIPVVSNGVMMRMAA